MRLTNAPFKIEFDGAEYEVQKANLSKIAQYQARRAQYLEAKEGGWEAKLIAFCIFLVLKDSIPGLTEDQVLEKTPGDLDGLELMYTMGFMRPAKVKTVPVAEETSASSSPQ